MILRKFGEKKKRKSDKIFLIRFTLYPNAIRNISSQGICYNQPTRLEMPPVDYPSNYYNSHMLTIEPCMIIIFLEEYQENKQDDYFKKYTHFQC